jgi:excisionase family DNA binding protein
MSSSSTHGSSSGYPGPSHSQAPPIAYSEDELVALCGISKRKLYDLRKKGRIPFKKVGRRVVYSAEKIRAWLSSGGEDGLN